MLIMRTWFGFEKNKALKNLMTLDWTVTLSLL